MHVTRPIDRSLPHLLGAFLGLAPPVRLLLRSLAGERERARTRLLCGALPLQLARASLERRACLPRVFAEPLLLGLGLRQCAAERLGAGRRDAPLPARTRGLGARRRCLRLLRRELPAVTVMSTRDENARACKKSGPNEGAFRSGLRRVRERNGTRVRGGGASAAR
jgi:hypothetical protein